jgi:hypothetical protein
MITPAQRNVAAFPGGQRGIFQVAILTQPFLGDDYFINTRLCKVAASREAYRQSSTLQAPCNFGDFYFTWEFSGNSQNPCCPQTFTAFEPGAFTSWRME